MNPTYEIDGIRITVCKTLAEAQSARRTRPNAPDEAFLFPVTIPVDGREINGTAMLGYDLSTQPFVSIIYNWTPPETAKDFGYMLDDFTAWTDCTGTERDAEGTLLAIIL